MRNLFRTSQSRTAVREREREREPLFTDNSKKGGSLFITSSFNSGAKEEVESIME